MASEETDVADLDHWMITDNDGRTVKIETIINLEVNFLVAWEDGSPETRLPFSSIAHTEKFKYYELKRQLDFEFLKDEEFHILADMKPEIGDIFAIREHEIHFLVTFKEKPGMEVIQGKYDDIKHTAPFVGYEKYAADRLPDGISFGDFFEAPGYIESSGEEEEDESETDVSDEDEEKEEEVSPEAKKRRRRISSDDEDEWDDTPPSPTSSSSLTDGAPWEIVRHDRTKKFEVVVSQIPFRTEWKEADEVARTVALARYIKRLDRNFSEYFEKKAVFKIHGHRDSDGHLLVQYQDEALRDEWRPYHEHRRDVLLREYEGRIQKDLSYLRLKTPKKKKKITPVDLIARKAKIGFYNERI